MEKLRTKIIGWRIHVIFFLLLCMGCPSLQAQDPSLLYPVPINAVYFPDWNFRTWVQEQDKDDDGNLSLAECGAVIACNVASMGIESLYGIGYFYALEELDCSGNLLESLPIDKNLKLKILNCSNNALRSLDIEKNEKLEYVNCSNNVLRSLDIEKNEELKYVNCSNNEVRLFNVGEIKKIEDVDCSNNKISSLFPLLSSLHPSLKSVDCSGNLLDRIEIDGHLEFLDCSHNSITLLYHYDDIPSLDSYICVYVDTLICSHNQLKYLWHDGLILDCSYNELTTLYIGIDDYSVVPYTGIVNCSHNKLRNFANTGRGWPILHSLDYSYNEIVEQPEALEAQYVNCSNNNLVNFKTQQALTIDCSNNLITSLSVLSADLQSLDCTGNPISTLSISGRESAVICDGGFDDFIQNLDTLILLDFSVDNLNFSEASRIKYLWIKDCPSLLTVNCSGSPLRFLSVRGETGPASINCASTKIEKLNLIDCDSIVSLNCSRTNIKKLDVSGLYGLLDVDCSNCYYMKELNARDCVNLKNLNCSNLEDNGFPMLTSLNKLDVVNCGMLQSLDCSGNIVLSELNLVTNTNLLYLNCCWCDLTNLELRNCKKLIRADVSSQPLEALSVRSLCELTYLKGTDIVILDASHCASLDTLILGQIKSLDISYCSRLKSFDLSCFPSLEELDVSGTNFTEVDCHDSKLRELRLADCDSLRFLNCAGNQLAFIDLSGCPDLASLDCSNNQFTSIDISSCPDLASLDCSNNQFTSIDISSCPDLASLDCSNNQIVSIDISSCPDLASLDCSNNQLESIDMSSCLDLTSLYCFDNQLESIDISGCPALTSLDCSNNQLVSIDVSGCPDLTSLDCSNNRLTGNLYCADRNMVYLDFSNNRLDSVDCSNNQLATLNVKESPSLSFLDCSRNQLSELSFGNDYGVLRYLDCSRNQLTTLYCPACSDLKILDCSNNYLGIIELGSAHLDSIDCSNNHLWDLGSAPIDQTRYLDCSHNKLEHLASYNFSGPLDDLEFLDCSDNLLACIDRTDAGGIIDMPNLKFLKCDNNPLQNNFLAGDYPSLEYLDCSEGELTGFSLSDRVPVLQVLNCSSNRLDSIDVSNNVALQALNCSNNRLTGMDLSNNLALRDLDFSNNRLACMDLSLHENIESIIDSNNYYFLYLGAGNACDIASIPGFDLGRVSSVEGGAIENQTLVFHADTLSYSYDYRCPAMERKGIFHLIGEARIPVDSTHFPDPAFLQYVSEIIDISGDDYLSEDEIEFVTYMDVSGRGIRSLQGLECFPQLRKLFCQDNMLTSIDLSRNPLVERLDTEDNHTYVLTGDDRTFNLNSLPGFDVSKASDWIGGKVQDTVLTFEQEEVSYLYNTGYQGHTRLPDVRFFLDTEIPADIAPVDASTFPDSIFRNYVSEHIDLSRNGILNAKEVESVKHLDVSNLGIRSLQGIEYFTELESLDCSGNELTSLDLSKNSNLQELDAEDNVREVAIADDNGFELSSLQGFEPGRASGWQGGRVEAGTLYFESREVSYAYAVGRTLSSGESTVRFRLRASQPLFVCELDELNFPDAAFRAVVASQVDTSGDNRLDSDEIARITSLDVSNLGIRSLQGIEYFTELESLDCSDNELTSLDLSRNAKLQVLNAEDNQLDIVLDEQNRFDISSLPGFDRAKASDWTGCTRIGNSLTFIQQEVTYTYATGYNGENEDADLQSVIFSLMADRDPSVANEASGLLSQGQVYVKNHVIHVKGIETEISVYSASGCLIYRGFDKEVPVQYDGVYLVRSGQQVWKVLVM